MPNRNIKVIIQYDGTNFHGWQRQPDMRTVQGELERAIQDILRIPVITQGASRTDAGVHALGQVANFQTENGLTTDRLMTAVNSRLPEDAKITYMSEVPDDFNSRFSATGKVYRYLILNQETANPLLRQRALHVPNTLNIGAMTAAANEIKGEDDYAAFGAKILPEDNTACYIEKVAVETISSVQLPVCETEIICIEVKGSRFLYKMVRTIAGTLLEVGKGRLLPGDIRGIIESRNRREAGPTLEPHGLYLVEVLY